MCANIQAKMTVKNDGISLPIDPFPETSIYFRVNEATFLISNLQRTDGLTTLQGGGIFSKNEEA